MAGLSANQAEHLRRLKEGDRLVGPARVRKVGNTYGARPWGFASGARAHAQIVQRLAARGLIVITEAGAAREARLP